MYRAVALQAQRENIALERIEELKELCRRLDLRFKGMGTGKRICIGDEDVSAAIRSPEIDLLSSRISAIKEVREAMTALQRKWARDEDLVAEGRDMGTMVFPDAPFKFFITASMDVRTERRYQERINRGEKVLRHQVSADLAKRDNQDQTRTIAPSIPARDAIIIDTSRTTPEQVVGIILEKIKDRSGEAS